MFKEQNQKQAISTENFKGVKLFQSQPRKFTKIVNLKTNLLQQQLDSKPKLFLFFKNIRELMKYKLQIEILPT